MLGAAACRAYCIYVGMRALGLGCRIVLLVHLIIIVIFVHGNLPFLSIRPESSDLYTHIIATKCEHFMTIAKKVIEMM